MGTFTYYHVKTKKTFDTNREENSSNSQMETSLKLFGSEFDNVVIVDLNLTANLLVALSNNDLVDSDQQTVNEWLAVAQKLIRAQL